MFWNCNDLLKRIPPNQIPGYAPGSSSHNWSSTARVAHQGCRSWGLGGSDPQKYVGKVNVCFDPLKMSHSFIQNCCRITASFTTSRMNSWTLITSVILFMLTMLPFLCLISSKQTVSSNQCLCRYTGLKVIVAKDKTPKRGCRWPAVNNPDRWCTS